MKKEKYNKGFKYCNIRKGFHSIFMASSLIKAGTNGRIYEL